MGEPTPLSDPAQNPTQTDAQTSVSGEPESTTVHHRTCHLCEAMCGLDITVADQRVGLVRGDRADVFSKGYLCPKGASIGHVHHDQDRLRLPLIRRGDNVETATWDEVSWADAFAEIDRRLTDITAKHGRDSVAVYAGNPSSHSHHTLLMTGTILRALGTKNFFSASTVDQMPKHVSSGLMFGHPDMIAVPDLDRTDFLLILGADPMESNGSLCTAPDFPGRLRAIRERGGTLVVVDPRRSRTAELADEHIPIRPGSDALFLLALANVLVTEGLADPGRLADFTDGLDRAAEVLAGFTTQAVSAATGIDADVIESVARRLAQAPTAAVYSRIGTHTTRFGTLAAWATDLVNVLTGNLDRPGGAMFAHPPHVRPGKGSGRGFTLGRWRSRVNDRPEARAEYPVSELATEILTPGDGQIRALITIAGNPALSTPDSGRLNEALADLDLMVSVDPWRNETTRHAHVILPPPGPLARSQYDLPFSKMAVRNIARWSPPVFEAPEPDGPAEWEILAKLALIASGMGPDADAAIVGDLLVGELINRASASTGLPVENIAEMVNVDGRCHPDRAIDVMIRMGSYGDRFGGATEPLHFDDVDVPPLSLDVLQRNPHGVDLGALRSELPAFLATQSGKIDLFPQAIVDDLARLRMHMASEPPDMVLVGRRHLRSNNSWMHNTKVLVKGKDRCTLQMHPDDAERLGLAHSTTVRVSSDAGSIIAPLELVDTIMNGVVSLPHGWGHDMAGTALSVANEHPGVNSNVLTTATTIDPLSGNAQLNAIPVTIAAE